MDFFTFAAKNARREFPSQMLRPRLAPIHAELNRRWALVEAGMTPIAALEKTWWERNRASDQIWDRR